MVNDWHLILNLSWKSTLYKHDGKKWMIRKSCMVANNFVLISWGVWVCGKQSSSSSSKVQFSKGVAEIKNLGSWVPFLYQTYYGGTYSELCIWNWVEDYVYKVENYSFSSRSLQTLPLLIIPWTWPLQLMSMASQRVDICYYKWGIAYLKYVYIQQSLSTNTWLWI